MKLIVGDFINLPQHVRLDGAVLFYLPHEDVYGVAVDGRYMGEVTRDASDAIFHYRARRLVEPNG